MQCRPLSRGPGRDASGLAKWDHPPQRPPRHLQLDSLELRDALPSMAELLLPPSLTELHIDR